MYDTRADIILLQNLGSTKFFRPINDFFFLVFAGSFNRNLGHTEADEGGRAAVKNFG